MPEPSLHHRITAADRQAILRAVADEDAVHDAFVALTQHDLALISNVPGFWYRIAIRRRIDRQRRDQRAMTTCVAIASEEPAEADQVDDLLDELDEMDQLAHPSDHITLAQVLPQLAPGRRALIEAELEGITDTAELAAVLGSTPGAVRVLRHRTYAQLRTLLAA